MIGTHDHAGGLTVALIDGEVCVGDGGAFGRFGPGECSTGTFDARPVDAGALVGGDIDAQCARRHGVSSP